MIASGAGRRGVTLTQGAGGALAITLAPSDSGSASFRRVKLEFGTVATGWQDRGRPLEELLCRRYHWRPDAQWLIEGYQEAGAALRQSLTLPVPMRAAPSVSYAVSQELNVQGGDRGVTALSPSLVQGFATAQETGPVRAGFAALAFDAEL